jgi:hypothetical protein
VERYCGDWSPGDPGRKLKCALAVCLACLLSASSSAQEVSIPLTDSRLVASGKVSTKPSDIVQRLSLLSTQLLNEVDASQVDLDALKSLLSESKNALTSSQLSLDQALAEAKKRNLELWLWRGGTALGLAGTVAVFVWGASR